MPMKAEGSPYSRHIPALDGLRGLAIAGVMGSHVFPGNAATGIERVVQRALTFGSRGVDLFFVLSGFLITGILFDTKDDPRFFRKFYARRVLRIFPLYYGVLLVFGIAAMVRSEPVGRDLLSLVLYVQNTDWIAPPAARILPLGHFWSLAIEEQFYLMWPLVVFAVRRRERLLSLCGAAMILLPLLRLAWLHHGANPLAVHVNTALRADSLLCGGGLALLLRGKQHDRMLRAAPWVFLATALGIAVMESPRVVAAGSQSIQAVDAFEYSAVALASAAMLALALRRGLAASFFQQPWLRVLGKYSYGLYVLHVLVERYVQIPLKSALAAMHVSKAATVLLTGAAVVALSFVAAWLSYQLYERHFLRLKRYFEYREPTS